MNFTDRKKEWIHKPVFNGAPTSWAGRYFQYRLQYFRDNHQEFDAFLIEIGNLLNNEKDDVYRNLKLFIGGNPQTNWVSPCNVMFDAFIKLYNFCLSPKQAYEYIKECARHYKQMSKTKYKLDENIEFSIVKSRYDGKLRKMVKLTMSPANELTKDKNYWFNVSFSSKVIRDNVNDICLYPDIAIDTSRSEDITEDTMMLFERYQNKSLSKSVFEQALEQLKQRGVLEEVSVEEKKWYRVYNYRIKDNILPIEQDIDFYHITHS